MILLLLLIFLVVVLLAALAFGAWLLYQRELSSMPAVPASPVQNILSPDGNLQAEIRNRPDGTFQVEVRRRKLDDSPDTSPVVTWILVYGPAITASLAEAVDIANQQVGA
jgi:hypothetical protein